MQNKIKPKVKAMDADSPFHDYEQEMKKSRTWLAIATESGRPSLDPSKPQMLMVGVKAVRSDMVKVRVEGGLFQDRIKMLTATQAAMAMAELIKDLVQRLETYRECDCTNEASCKIHNGGRVN